jgi:energy-coupling factor transport system ATP-binding protein
MIELTEISISLPDGTGYRKQILKNFSLKVERGDWVAIVGPNGSGKTTLLKVIARLLPPSSGTLSVDTLAHAGAGAAPRTTTGLMLQEPDNQFVAGTVRNELQLSVAPLASPGERRHRIDEAVERFSLERFLDRNPHRLSGGEKQRLAMATVWLSDPAVLLLDEPTSYLDDRRMACVEFIRELNAQGVTIIWATPGGDDVLAARRVVYIDGGELKFEGNPSQLFDAAGRDQFDCLFPSKHRQLVRATGSENRVNGPSRGITGDEATAAVLRMESASFAYEDDEILHDITLSVRAGDGMGVTGLNGSGKSTLLCAMSGILQPKTGQIFRLYKKAVEKGEQKIFHLFQNPERLFFAESVFEEVAFGLKSLGLDKRELPMRVTQSLSHVGLSPDGFLHRSPFSLSFGEMRRLAFAMALALKPMLLVLDEPASCLDAAGCSVLAELIGRLREGGSTVVIASSVLAGIPPGSNRRITLDDGRIAAA